MVRDVRGPEWSFLRFQNLDRVVKIPTVVLDGPDTGHDLFVWLCVLKCYFYV